MEDPFTKDFYAISTVGLKRQRRENIDRPIDALLYEKEESDAVNCKCAAKQFLDQFCFLFYINLLSAVTLL